MKNCLQESHSQPQPQPPHEHHIKLNTSLVSQLQYLSYPLLHYTYITTPLLETTAPPTPPWTPSPPSKSKNTPTTSSSHTRKPYSAPSTHLLRAIGVLSLVPRTAGTPHMLLSTIVCGARGGRA
ncbi:hypothetical protein CC86DRAFT_1146 [Ophiobolus disseminans]|uniref:Uncharacterized protein n=1 Tax=Ophiobolus disseminans TaxID=1469910 RepID=A0A6A7AHT3_9PLEO|nr:hypothetical protein CC86DRAFT_1146 [Ophiobolus disseminans]